MPDTILYTVCFSDFYGTQQSILSTVRSLDRARFSPIVATPPGDEFNENLRVAGVDVVELPFHGLFDLDTARRLASLCRRRKVSLIHAHLGISTFLSLAAAGLAGGIPVVATRHFVTDRYSTIASPLVFNAYRHMYKAMNSRLKKIIFVSEAARKSVESREGPFKGKAVVVHNSIDLSTVRKQSATPPDEKQRIRKEFGVPPDAFMVLSLSRLSYEKDIPTLLRAAAALKDKRNDFFFVITGAGPLMEELKAMARDLGVDGNVNFCGFVKNKEKVICAADASVLCSSVDSFGISVLETMAAGVPSISAAGGGPLEIITDGKDGLIFQPGDANALAALLERLANNPDEANALGRAGMIRAADFSEKAITPKLEAVYNEVLGDPR